MLQQAKLELRNHVLELMVDGALNDDNRDDWHFHAFNETPYIIGSYNAKQWLSEHGICSFDAISEIVEYEKDNFGEVTTDVSCPERVLNMLVYIYGEEIISELDEDLSAKKIKKALRAELLA